MNAATPDSATQVAIYRTMALIKINDEHLLRAIKAGKLSMPYYSARGQECIPAAISQHLTNDDYLVTIYRGIHDMLAKGVPVKNLWAELAGKVTGTCKGKGGPMHITHPDSGCMVTTGIVGAGIPIACGMALASQLRDDKRVTVTNFGDGASNIGAFHEAMNLASVWNLPVIFVCQNNLYAEHTALSVGTSIENIADRAQAYSMPGVTVDGNDPIAVYNVMQEAVERARSGNGPTLIEAKTFRFNGHVFGDAGEYIPEEEYKAAVANDPYPRFRTALVENGHATDDQLDAIDAEIEVLLNEAEEFAYSSEFSDADEVQRDIYASVTA